MRQDIVLQKAHTRRSRVQGHSLTLASGAVNLNGGGPEWRRESGAHTAPHPPMQADTAPPPHPALPDGENRRITQFMIRFFDMDDRARLRERFYGATRSVLARSVLARSVLARV